MPTPTSAPIRGGVARRLLGSPFVDLLLGPHGVDRYLELIRPSLTVRDARAEVVDIWRQTPRSVTMALRPNAAWGGFRAGQFVRAGFEIDGVRRTRTYSPAGSEHGARGLAGSEHRSRGPAGGEHGSGGLLELTVTTHPGGLVSQHLRDGLRPGSIVHLGPAQGEFVLPDVRPPRLLLISGGSGITPVISMLRTLCDEDHGGEITFLHYARTESDWLYESEARALARRHAGVDVVYRATRTGSGDGTSGHLDAAVLGDIDGSCWGAVCGPPSLIEGARAAWAQLGGRREQLLTETFTPPRLTVTADAVRGSLRFLHSEHSAPIATGTLLEQAEAAGLSPDFGCRMGICHTCTCRKAAGAVRNLLTGEVSEEEDEDIQLCVSVPAGDVALEL